MDKKNVIVLLVEDDPDDQFLFKDVMFKLDPEIQLHMVSGADKAIEFIESTLPTIIFLDINMPLQSGKECLKRIRNKPEWNQIKVVMFTTSSSNHDIDDCFENGADRYVIKPLSVVDQSKILKKLIFLHLSDLINPPTRKDFVFTVYS
jgi:CheY-like chemotaxis protein